MPTVTVPRIVRPGAGYETIEARWGVRPTLIDPSRGTVVFPEPDPLADPPAEPLDLAVIAEWLRTRDDAEMAQRLAIKDAFLAILQQDPKPELPETADLATLLAALVDKVAWLEERDARWLAVVAPLALLFGMAPQ